MISEIMANNIQSIIPGIALMGEMLRILFSFFFKIYCMIEARISTGFAVSQSES